MPLPSVDARSNTYDYYLVHGVEQTTRGFAPLPSRNEAGQYRGPRSTFVRYGL